MLVSGGLDSATVLAMAVARGLRCHALSVDYGQRHRAELAGGPWRLFVDLIGGVLIVMSLIGYAIFLSLRFRLRTALGLTALSLAVMVGLFLLTVA